MRSSLPPASDGQVAERLKAAVLKTAVRVSVPWVRIPPLPPVFFDHSLKIQQQ